MTCHVVIFRSFFYYPLLTVIIFDALRFTGIKIGGVNQRTPLEGGPKQIISDFTILKERDEALDRRLVRLSDEAHQLIEMLQACWIMERAIVRTISICFQFREVGTTTFA